jgi:hypothetical protein
VIVVYVNSHTQVDRKDEIQILLQRPIDITVSTFFLVELEFIDSLINNLATFKILINYKGQKKLKSNIFYNLKVAIVLALLYMYP